MNYYITPIISIIYFLYTILKITPSHFNHTSWYCPNYKYVWNGNEFMMAKNGIHLGIDVFLQRELYGNLPFWPLGKIGAKWTIAVKFSLGGRSRSHPRVVTKNIF